ncbi:MAG: MobP3 family relaxase [Oscillospiraceae bacterium]
MQGVVYKQWHSEVKNELKPMLDVKHLRYIATKLKECEYNPGCGFSLWGTLTGHIVPDNIQDFELAKSIIRKASSDGKIIHRSVLSLDDETAQIKGFYARDAWQALTQAKVNAIAKEMNIKPESFCWVASFHNKKGHPHAHIMFWDKSADLHEEFIPPERFAIASEHIRAAFNKELFAEEIKQLHMQSDDIEKLLKADFEELINNIHLDKAGFTSLNNQIADIFGENVLQAANIPFNVSTLSDEVLSDISKQLFFICSSLPENGRLAYKLLEPKLKNELDKLTAVLLQLPGFTKLYADYIDKARQLSVYYGNGAERTVFNIVAAQKEINNLLGNQILRFIKSNDLSLAPLSNAAGSVLNDNMLLRLRSTIKATAAYDLLLGAFPERLTPYSVFIENEPFKSLLKQTIDEIMENTQIKNLSDKYALTAKAARERLTGAKSTFKEDYSKIYSEVREAILTQLKDDKGWTRQIEINQACRLFLSCLRSFSACSPRSRSNNKAHSRERAKAQLKDLKKILESSSGEWDAEL